MLVDLANLQPRRSQAKTDGSFDFTLWCTCVCSKRYERNQQDAAVFQATNGGHGGWHGLALPTSPSDTGASSYLLWDPRIFVTCTALWEKLQQIGAIKNALFRRKQNAHFGKIYVTEIWNLNHATSHC